MRLRGGAAADTAQAAEGGAGPQGKGRGRAALAVWKLLEVSQHRRPGSFRRVCRQRIPSPD